MIACQLVYCTSTAGNIILHVTSAHPAHYRNQYCIINTCKLGGIVPKFKFFQKEANAPRQRARARRYSIKRPKKAFQRAKLKSRDSLLYKKVPTTDTQTVKHII